jgi:zinc protease
MFYHPQNAIAVAIGPFDAGAMLEAITRSFAEVPPGPSAPPMRVREPEQEGERRVVLHRPGGATSYLHIAYHVPAATHPDLAALLVTDGILSGFKGIVPFDQAGGGRSSRLYRALVDTRLATDVSSSVTPSADPTLFRVAATVRTGGEVGTVEERILTEVDRLTREPARADELAKVKKQAKAQLIFSRDGVFRLAMGLGAFAVVDEPAAFESLVERIDRVTADDVMRVAATYLTERTRTVGSYLPVLGATASAAQAAVRPEVFFIQAPRAGRARQ